MNTEFVQLIFRKLSQISNHSEYAVDNSTAEYVLNWFFHQDRLPHTEKALKFLIFQLFLSYPDSLDLKTARKTEELTLDYWDEIMVSDCEGWYETFCSVPV